MDSYQGGSRSPPFNDTYERRYTDRPSPGGRSDDTEIVWRRDDRFGNGKKSEDGRVGNGGIKVEGTSLDFQSDLDSCSPMVRPVRDILGENVSPLRVIEPSLKANGGKSADPSLHTQV